MTRSRCTPVCLLVVLFALGAHPSVVNAQTSQLKVTLTELGTDAPLAGADVRVLNGQGHAVAQGITNGAGVYQKAGLPSGATTVEYQMLGYLNYPESTAVTLTAGANHFEGRLLRKTDDADYLHRVGVAIGRLSENSGAGNVGRWNAGGAASKGGDALSDLQSRKSAEAEWKKVEGLSQDAQVEVAKAIPASDRKYLTNVESFKQAQKQMMAEIK